MFSVLQSRGTIIIIHSRVGMFKILRVCGRSQIKFSLSGVHNAANGRDRPRTVVHNDVNAVNLNCARNKNARRKLLIMKDENKIIIIKELKELLSRN